MKGTEGGLVNFRVTVPARAKRAQKDPNFGEPKGCLTITESVICILRVWGPCQGRPVDTVKVARGEIQRHQAKGLPLGMCICLPSSGGPMVPMQTVSKAAPASLACCPDSAPQPQRLRAFCSSVVKYSPFGAGGKLSPNSSRL